MNFGLSHVNTRPEARVPEGHSEKQAGASAPVTYDMQLAPSRRAGVNKPAKDDSISRVSGKNQPMLSRSSWFDEVPLGAGLSAIRSAG